MLRRWSLSWWKRASAQNRLESSLRMRARGHMWYSTCNTMAPCCRGSTRSTHTHTHTHTNTQTHKHTHIRTHAHAHAHTRTHTHTDIHTHTHTCTHTHTHFHCKSYPLFMYVVFLSVFHHLSSLPVALASLLLPPFDISPSSLPCCPLTSLSSFLRSWRLLVSMPFKEGKKISSFSRVSVLMNTRELGF